MLGPWLPFPPRDPEEWTQVPEGPGVYALADRQGTILAISGAPALRRALQELAAAPPLPLKDLATHLRVEASGEPDRRRAEIVAALYARTGVFPPCSRHHPRYPARLPAWWAVPRVGQGLPAETVNLSGAGLLLALGQRPGPGAAIRVRVETPFGLVEAEGRIVWTKGEGEAHRAGIALTRFSSAGDRARWERLIGRLAEQVPHA